MQKNPPTSREVENLWVSLSDPTLEESEIAELIPTQLDSLQKGFASIKDIGFQPMETLELEFILANPQHPMSTRMPRIQAANSLLRIANAGRDCFTPSHLDTLHTALFDVCPAVQEDIVRILGILSQTDSVAHLQEFAAMIHDRPGMRTVAFECQYAIQRCLQNAGPLVDRRPAQIEVAPLGDSRRVRLSKLVSLRLKKSGANQWILTSDGADEGGVLLTDSEAKSLTQNGETSLLRFLTFGGDAQDLDNLVNDITASNMPPWATNQVTATLVDTTSLHAAILCVSRRLLFPELLLDLSNIVTACALYDNILVYETQLNGIPAELREIVLPIRRPDEESALLPWNTAVQRSEELFSDPKSRSELEDAWAQVLGARPTIDFRSFDGETRSPSIHGYCPGSDGGLDFHDPLQASLLDAERLTKDASVQTYRYFVNEKIAEIYGSSYSCTSLRFPVEAVALGRRDEFRTAQEELLNQIIRQRSSVGSPNRRRGYIPAVTIPGPLGLVLKRSKSLGDIWRQTLKVRQEFQPLRDWIRKHQTTYNINSADIFELLDGAIPRNSQIPSSLDFTFQATAKIAAATAFAPGQATVAMKAASAIKPISQSKAAMEAVARPELKVVRKLSSELQHLTAHQNSIAKLWGMPLNRAWLAKARTVSEVSSRTSGILSLQ